MDASSKVRWSDLKKSTRYNLIVGVLFLGSLFALSWSVGQSALIKAENRQLEKENLELKEGNAALENALRAVNEQGADATGESPVLEPGE